MAKGVEDTTFYRWHQLVGLAEVGGDPGAIDDPSVTHLHAWARRQAADHPTGMTTLSTHDTKRSEDVRARLLAAAGDPPGWRAAWEPLRAAADRLRVDPPTAYLVLQTLLGAWPIELDRVEEYLVKATREAKRRTTWTDPEEAYEARVVALARAALDDPALRGAVTGLVESSARRPARPSSGRSCCSSRCPACRTSTRAARWSTCRWSTPTTGGRSTTPS